jgi:O-antigen/teichoic acid export membrane protein
MSAITETRLKERLVKSAFWMIWSRGALQAASLFSTLLVARLLSPTEYGLMALASIWTNATTCLAELGLGAAIIQFLALTAVELNACFWLTFGLALLAYGALFAAAPGIAYWFATPAPARCCALWASLCRSWRRASFRTGCCVSGCSWTGCRRPRLLPP